MGAYSIYDASRREKPDSWQEYYLSLREALYSELMNDGASELVNELQALEKGSSIQYLAAAAVYDCYYMLVLGRPQTDVTVYFPSWQGEKQPWSVLERYPGEYCVSVQGALMERLAALQAVSRQMYDLRVGAIPPSEESAAAYAARREDNALKHQVDKLRQENTTLRELNQTLSRELMEIENGYVNDRVQVHIAERRREAEAAFEKENEERRREAESAFERHYAAQQEVAHSERDAVYYKLFSVMDHHRDGSRAVRDSIGEAVKAMQRELERQTNAWTASLRSVDYRFLAECYVSLYRVVHDDMAHTLAKAAAQGTPDEAMQALHDLHGRFCAQMTRMECMMQQLGLTVLRPGEGDAYDERRHQLTYALTGFAMPDDMVVSRMLLPGVTYDEHVLVRATVEIRTGK